MPGARRTRKGQTGRRPSAEMRRTTSGVSSGPDRYSGRENFQAGSKGKEPGGRWTRAYYEGPAKIISRDNVR